MHWKTEEMLSAVELWAFPKWWLLRETATSVIGRIDGLLIPSSIEAAWLDRNTKKSWTSRCHIIGVEVKANRVDYLRGLEEKQFERYAETLPALFVLTGREVKTKEVPKEYGHLVWWDHERVVCRRYPPIHDIPLDEDSAWRIILAMGAEYRKSRQIEELKIEKASKNIGQKFQKIFAETINLARKSQ